MATQEVVYTGKVKYAQVYPGQVNKFGKNSVEFYPIDDATRRAIQALKTRNALKEDQDGFHFTFTKNPKDTRNPPIVVIDEAGNPITESIGNGSKVELTLQTYTWDDRVNNDTGEVISAGTGARIVRVRVLELVPYQRRVEGGTSVGVELPV